MVEELSESQRSKWLTKNGLHLIELAFIVVAICVSLASYFQSSEQSARTTAIEQRMLRLQEDANSREQEKRFPDVSLSDWSQIFQKDQDGKYIAYKSRMAILKNICSQPLHKLKVYWHKPKLKSDVEREIAESLDLPAGLNIPTGAYDFLNVVRANEELEAFEKLDAPFRNGDLGIENFTRIIPQTLLPSEIGAIESIPPWIAEMVALNGKVHGCVVFLGETIQGDRLNVSYAFDAKQSNEENQILVEVIDLVQVARNQSDPRDKSK